MRLVKVAIIALLFALACPAIATAEGGFTPLQVRNQFPLFLSFHPPYLEDAKPADSVFVGLSHSSVYVIESGDVWTVDMDMEITELDLRLKKTAGSGTEIGMEVPVIRQTRGFLDRPLAAYHAFLHVGDYGRAARPDNDFLYQVLYQGRPVIVGVNDRTAFGDTRLTVKQLLRPSDPVISLMVDAELPTGEANEGYGNGNYDYGTAVLMTSDAGGLLRMVVNLGYVFLGDLKAYQTIPLKNFAYAGVGFQATVTDRFALLVQSIMQTSPFPDTGIHQVDTPGVLLTFGGRYSFGSTAIEFSLTEDPDLAGAPDFIANTGLTIRY